LLLGGLLAALGWSVPVHAATRFVDGTPSPKISDWDVPSLPGGVPNSCLVKTDPCATIAHAVAVALADDVIQLTNFPFVAFDNHDVMVTKNLTFEGVCKGNCAVPVKVNARGNGRHFAINSGVTVVMSNLDLYGGSGATGGSISNSGTLTLRGCKVRGNVALQDGGGIFVGQGGTLVVESSDCLDNTAANGGCVSNDGGVVTFTQSTFTRNTVDHGGGVVRNSRNGVLTVASSVFNLNSAIDGGAIDLVTGTLTVTKSTFASNAAERGGAIHDASPTARSDIDASTFSLNSADAAGGAIHHGGAGATMNIVNSTFSRNDSGDEGAAVYNGNSGNVTSVKVISSTFYHNTAQNGGALYNEKSLEMNNSIVTESFTGGSLGAACSPNNVAFTGTGNLVGTGSRDFSCNASAIFNIGWITGFDTTLQDNDGPKQGTQAAPTLTHALLAGSNAIDRISSLSCLAPDGSLLASDQRTAVRPQGGRCDIGAVEQQ